MMEIRVLCKIPVFRSSRRELKRKIDYPGEPHI
jgi:hypothetical protein